MSFTRESHGHNDHEMDEFPEDQQEDHADHHADPYGKHEHDSQARHFHPNFQIILDNGQKISTNLYHNNNHMRDNTNYHEHIITDETGKTYYMVHPGQGRAHRDEKPNSRFAFLNTTPIHQQTSRTDIGLVRGAPSYRPVASAPPMPPSYATAISGHGIFRSSTTHQQLRESLLSQMSSPQQQTFETTSQSRVSHQHDEGCCTRNSSSHNHNEGCCHSLSKCTIM